MARLFTCGFEENDFLNTVWNEAAATQPTLVTSPVHSGGRAAKWGSVDGNTSIARYLASKTSGTVFLRLYWRPEAGTDTTFRDRVRFDGGSTGAKAQWKPSTGQWKIVNVITATEATFTTALSNDTWYRLEMDVLLHNTTGSITARLYDDSGTLLETETISNEDTLPTNLDAIRMGAIGGTGTGEIFYIDDIAINDETGSFQTSAPGPGKIAFVEPSTVVSAQWEDTASGTPGAGDVNAQNVDDLPGAPDDDTTYNLEDDTLNQVDRFTITGLPAEVPSNADMLVFDVYVRAKAGAARDIRLKVWDEGDTLTDGVAITLTTAYTAGANNPTHMVFDPGSRSKANVDLFDIGYENINVDATSRRVTALWANVEWNDAAAFDAALLAAVQQNNMPVLTGPTMVVPSGFTPGQVIT